jgi:peptidoglycan hydrolase FlgJ
MLQPLIQSSEYQAGDRAEQTAQRLQRMAKAQSGEDKAKMREVAQNFEGLFLGQMLENIFAGLETNELFGGGDAEDIYKSMMMEEYGKMMAKSGGIGVADHVMRQLLQQQEAIPAKTELEERLTKNK